MAHNLRSKIPFTDSLLIHDLNANATTKFASEEKGVEVAPNVRDVAEKSVGNYIPFLVHYYYVFFF